MTTQLPLLPSWRWCTTHDSMCNTDMFGARTVDGAPRCLAADVLDLFHDSPTGPCTLHNLYTADPGPAVRPPAGVIGNDQAEAIKAAYSPTAPLGDTIGPATPFTMLVEVVDRAVETGAVVRALAPDIDLFRRVTLAGLERARVAVFTLHPDGERADITFHPDSTPAAPATAAHQN